MGSTAPPENTLEMRRPNTRSVLGIVGDASCLSPAVGSTWFRSRPQSAHAAARVMARRVRICIYPNSHVRSARPALSFGNEWCLGAHLPLIPVAKPRPASEIKRSQPQLAHSSRRGVARALMPAGGTFAQLLRAGQWSRNNVRPFLDFSDGKRRATADSLTEDSDDEPL